MKSVTIGSLFSGIGGLELGLERAGLGPVRWQVEKDPFCRSVLAKHWPDVEKHEDVKTVTGLERVDLICGGFPCQDVSSAGKRKGLDGERSGLWKEYRRIVRELRPRFVVVENVASGKRLWLPFVTADLVELGYHPRAFALSASDVGAPHLRRRIFVVAHAHGESEFARAIDAEVGGSPSPDADTVGLKRERGTVEGEAWCGRPQPSMVRVVHGLSRGVDGRRRRALGNAVVPQCAEAIGRMIQEFRGAK